MDFWNSLADVERAAAVTPYLVVTLGALVSLPEAFEQLIEASDFPDWSLHSAWRVAQEQAVEHDLTPAWFPAWMLLEEPGLADVLATCPAGDEPSRAFHLVIALLSHRCLDERGIVLRRSLHAIHPGLLERFLAKQARASAARSFIG